MPSVPSSSTGLARHTLASADDSTACRSADATGITPTIDRVSRVLLTCLLAATVLVGGCATDRPEATSPPAEPASSPAPAEPSTSADPDPSPTADPSATPRHGGRHKVGTLAPNPRPRRADTAAHLLPVEDLPAIGGTWSVAVTEGGEQDPTVGACQKTGLGTIGAVESVTRTYTSNGAVAVQVVARFGDAKSAWRAHAVLEAWRTDCAERLRNVTVSELEDVTVPAGTGSSYRAEQRLRAAGLGILRNGAYLTVVEIAAAGYPSRWEPARVAVRRIARTF